MLRFCSAMIATLLAVTVVHAGEREEAAESAALDWLAYVDGGEYVTSWSNAGGAFKKQLTPQAWEDAASAARTPLGALRGRSLQATRYATSLPGAPDGEYVVLQFDASFANKATSVETVTTVLESGVWRVVGYFIR